MEIYCHEFGTICPMNTTQIIIVINKYTNFWVFGPSLKIKKLAKTMAFCKKRNKFSP